jgi:TRAP transporter TAXI family solute receptor
MTLYPASPIAEAAVNNKLILMDIEPAITSALSEKYGYGVSVIPAGTYEFQTADTHSASSYTVICVPKFSDNEVAYKVAKSIMENLDYLRAVHVSMETLTSKELTENLGAPLHPGAELYYREQGVLN